MPGARCTRSLVCAWGNKYAHEYSQRAIGKHPTFPHAMVYGLYVLSPVIGFLVTVACKCKLDAGVEALGPHDFAVRACARRLQRIPRPPHPAPRP
jgi:hypothetical protein